MTFDLRSQLIDEMQALFGDDQPRIDHAMRVLGFAEQILQQEVGRATSLHAIQEPSQAPGQGPRGGSGIPPRYDVGVVIAAAILHDIGIHAAEAKHGSGAGRYQEIEGPPIARAILEKHDLAPAAIDAVCTIIAHHHNGQIDTPEFNIIWDADWLVNFPSHYGQADLPKRSAAIERLFRTSTGKAMAEKTFLVVS